MLAAAGLLLSSRLAPDSTYVADILPGIMLASIGMGLSSCPITLIATSGIPDDDAGLASGLFNTSQQIGGALGLAVLSTLAANRPPTCSPRRGQAEPRQHVEALVDGFHVAWLGSAFLLAAGGLCCSPSCDEATWSPSPRSN